jgi:hypothetical protein
MLTYEPKARITALQALQHPYFTSSIAPQASPSVEATDDDAGAGRMNPARRRLELKATDPLATSNPPQ